METVIHRAEDRGHANFGWLDAYHSFSFGHWYEPSRTHFGLLRVLNDDTVSPGQGFGTHPHDNMEIITIPQAGVIEHKDSMGSIGQLRPGEVQVMSAGTGLTHSEYNGSDTETLKLFQIWIFPRTRGLKPRYDQRSFDTEGRKDKFQLVVSPDEKDGSLMINQDGYISLADFSEDKDIQYTLHKPGNGIYALAIEGEISAAGETLSRRDALGISEADAVAFSGKKGSRLLLIEVPMR